MKLTGEQASDLLRDRREFSKCDVSREVVELSSGPMIVLCLCREDAVAKWKELMGPENCPSACQSAPTSLRALYGDPLDDSKNAVFGSDNDEAVKHQLHFFFPNCKLASLKAKSTT